MYGRVPSSIHRSALKNNEQIQGEATTKNKAANRPEGDLESSIRKDSAIEQ